MEFFSEIFKDKPADHYITMWSLKNKQTQWFKEPSDLASKASHIKGEDIYFGLGSSKTNNGTNKRIMAKDVDGIGLIHCDIDFGTDGHKGKNYPPDINEALKLASMILIPSYVVHSGNGLHAYYLLKRYETNKEKLQRINDLQRQFQVAINTYSEFDIDMTHDLSRVLRIPDSDNCKDVGKGLPIKKCHIINDNHHLRYDIEDIANAIDKCCDTHI